MWEEPGAEMAFQDAFALLGFILEFKIHHKSIKNEIKLQIKFCMVWGMR